MFQLPTSDDLTLTLRLVRQSCCPQSLLRGGEFWAPSILRLLLPGVALFLLLLGNALAPAVQGLQSNALAFSP